MNCSLGYRRIESFAGIPEDCKINVVALVRAAPTTTLRRSPAWRRASSLWAQSKPATSGRFGSHCPGHLPANCSHLARYLRSPKADLHTNANRAVPGKCRRWFETCATRIVAGTPHTSAYEFDRECYRGKAPERQRVVGRTPRHLGAADAGCLTPGERREASDFLGMDLPAASGGGNEAQCLDARVAERRKAITHTRGKKSVLEKNLGFLQDTLQLSGLETNLIAFRAMLHLHAGFEALAGKYVGFCADFVFHRKLGRLFDAPDHAVELALDRTGRLVRHGLVEPKWSCTPALVHRLRLLPGLINALVSPAKSTDDFFRGSCRRHAKHTCR